MNRDAAIEAGARVLYERRWINERWDCLQDERRPYYRAETASVIDAAAPHLAGEPVGYVLANLVRRTVWMEQGVSTVADDVRHLREPRGDFVRCALVPVDETAPRVVIPDVETLAATLALAYGSHVSPPRGGRDWKAAEAVLATLVPVEDQP